MSPTWRTVSFPPWMLVPRVSPGAVPLGCSPWQAPEHEMYPYAEVIYSYSVDNESYSGSYIRGCWFDNTAERFAKRFMPPKRVIIRYRPDNPAESVIKEKEFNLGPSS